MRIAGIIDELERWPRQGGSVDDPEGGRFVVISETALTVIIRDLRSAALEGAEHLGAGACAAGRRTSPQPRLARER